MSEYPSREELRRWSAEELIGYRRLPASGVMNQDFYEDKHEQFICWAEPGFMPNIWAPDLKDSPAWQILAVIKKMWEMGWLFCEVFMYPAPEERNGHKWWCKFYKESKKEYFGFSVDMLTAILRAAYTAYLAAKETPNVSE